MSEAEAAADAPSLTVGTAGHIDHGKTALVRALTGRDTDRLAEERRRGMSIELGYAELALGGRRLSLVDVPGHERFVRTMIAGATGIDLYLLVVAADDGVMPQTREHLAVLGALGVEAGVVALTKVDLVDEATRERAAAAIRGLLPDAPIVAVSARTGAGVDALRARLLEVAERVDATRVEAADGAEPLLHVDRVFTVAGHGTVVTGTLWSGTFRRGDRVVVLPEGKEARIRSIESHDRSLEVVGPRRRVALNLAGLRREEVERGDVVTVAGAALAPTYRLDVELASGSEAILGERRVQVHHGTRESPARVVDRGDGAAQLRLERPLLARRGDRVVIRRIAPPDTLGGAVVTDPSPRRHNQSGMSDEDSGAQSAPKRRAPSVTVARELGPLAHRVLAGLRADGERPRTPARLAEDLDEPRRDVERAIGELVEGGAVVRFKADVVYPTAEAERLAGAVTELVAEEGSTSIAEVRDALGLSRKYAQALLEHLDGERVLRRDGDRHYPRGGAA
ncbi:MAG TPA: selenocysteine-specific translation elongation factor [Solirubrobacterales bacterium]|nr:selenocysteine-specific translation elongation factor [Solirubrobacterales bacterium]